MDKRVRLLLEVILVLGVIAAIIVLASLALRTAPPSKPVASASPAPAVASTSSPAAEKATPRPRLMLISIDGARDDYVDRFIADGTMPNLAKLAREGVRAEYLRSIIPSLTAAAHASIGTGAYPHRTGIVSNKFHKSEDPFYWYTSAFEEPELQAEPLWRTAMRHGLTTAAVFWYGAVPDIPEQQADYTVSYGKCDVYSDLHVITFTLASEWKNPPPSHSPLLEGVLDVLGRSDARVARLYALALDSTDDGVLNYDTIVLSHNREVNEDSATLRLGQWAPLEISARLHSGAFFKLQAITTTVESTDELTSTVPLEAAVFRSRVCFNYASPPELLREINERFGFFRPSPDYYALGAGWIDQDDYFWMAETQSRWMAEVAAFVYRRYRPDLFLTWQGPVDEAGHQFLLVDERQPGYSPEKARRYAELYRRAYQLADENIGRLMDAAGDDDVAFFIFSDHGMSPIHTQVYVNTVLNKAGLLEFKGPPKYYVNVEKSRAVAFASGAAAHVYVNLKGREQPGIVPESEYDSVVEEIVRAFQAVKDPTTGEPVFCRILKRDELADLKLDSPHSGDVFVQACPGYVLTDWRGEEEILRPATYYGQHGYDPEIPALHAFFVASGPGVKQEAQIGPLNLVDIAPTAARLLNIPPPADAEGRVVEELLSPGR